MNHWQCWNPDCKKEFEYEDPKYRDVQCPFCRIENTVFPPEEINQLTEAELDELLKQQREEEMIDYSSEKYQGKYVYLPKIGETAIFEIKELREVKSDNPKFNFSENVPVIIGGEQAIDDEGELIYKKKDLGYHIEAELTNGKILSVTSLAAFINVFKKHEINDGDKVKILHPEKGIWEVEKL